MLWNPRSFEGVWGYDARRVLKSTVQGTAFIFSIGIIKWNARCASYLYPLLFCDWLFIKTTQLKCMTAQSRINKGRLSNYRLSHWVQFFLKKKWIRSKAMLASRSLIGRNYWRMIAPSSLHQFGILTYKSIFELKVMIFHENPLKYRIFIIFRLIQIDQICFSHVFSKFRMICESVYQGLADQIFWDF